MTVRTDTAGARYGAPLRFGDLAPVCMSLLSLLALRAVEWFFCLPPTPQPAVVRIRVHWRRWLGIKYLGCGGCSLNPWGQHTDEGWAWQPRLVELRGEAGPTAPKLRWLRTP